MLLGRVLFFGPGFPGWLLCHPRFFCLPAGFFLRLEAKTPGSMMIIRQQVFEKVGTKKWRYTVYYILYRFILAGCYFWWGFFEVSLT